MIFFIYSAMYAFQIGSSGAIRCNDVNAVDNHAMPHKLGVASRARHRSYWDMFVCTPVWFARPSGTELNIEA